MLPAERKSISGEKKLSTLVRCALICKWVFRRAGLRTVANLALIAVLFDVAPHIHSELIKEAIAFACALLVIRPLVYLLMAAVLIVKLMPDKGLTQSQAEQMPGGVEKQNDSH